jgi:hypothetical protein
LELADRVATAPGAAPRSGTFGASALEFISTPAQY